MKKLLLSLLLAAGLAAFSNPARAGIPIFYSSGDQFTTTQQLPDSVQIDGQHVNLGLSFKEFAIMWIPMWTWGDVEYVAINDKGKEAWTLDEESLAYLQEEYGVTIEESPKIPFWHRIGGKAIWAVLIAGIIWSSLSKKDEKEEEGQTPEATEAPQAQE